MTKVLLFIALAFILPLFAAAQEKDSLIVKDSSGTITIGNKPDTSKPVKADSVTQKKHSPRKAAIRSAILPGLGQIYNKKYWKLPLVYTAIGIPVGLFINNKQWYDRTRYALAVVSSPNPSTDSLNAVHAQLRPLVDQKAQGSILRYRNEFRRNMDYSVLFTLLMWGLNIVDATVDAHLQGFNVSDDLSFRVMPALLPGNVPGVTFAFTLGRNNAKTISSPSQF
jgi:hypothetical protein